MYKNFLKRILDFSLSFLAIIILSPLFLILIVCGSVCMKGNPFFVQIRPGKKDKNGKEKLFKLIKFRTMTNEKDMNGNLLEDEKRLNAYGKFLRSSSLDELPELINIVVGDMAIIGPRPQLVKDMVFMTDEQRNRHSVRPGLSGLAQINGRNNISWEDKLDYDLKYIRNINIINDTKIIFKTLLKVFKREDVVREGTVSDIDFGDYLLKNGKIDIDQYNTLIRKAEKLLMQRRKK